MTRILLEHTQGPWAGLRQILGVLPSPVQLPATLTFNAGPDQRRTAATLARCEPGYAIYRENPLVPEKELTFAPFCS